MATGAAGSTGSAAIGRLEQRLAALGPAEPALAALPALKAGPRTRSIRQGPRENAQRSDAMALTHGGKVAIVTG
ncbi:MAG: hypothetical protein ACREFQ_19325, partial [Stellaceae bacterium]